TLGKKAFGTRVTAVDGGAVTASEAFGRAISRQLRSITYILGFIYSLLMFSARRRTLHDRAAGTIGVNAKPCAPRGALHRDQAAHGARRSCMRQSWMWVGA